MRLPLGDSTTTRLFFFSIKKKKKNSFTAIYNTFLHELNLLKTTVIKHPCVKFGLRIKLDVI